MELTRQILDRRRTENGEIVLWEVLLPDRGREYEIVFNGIFLMASYCGHSSEVLVEQALQRCPGVRPLPVLIGGLGMGYSVRAALADERVGEVTVIEIEEVVVEWNRGVLAPLHGEALADRRVRLVRDDFCAFIATTPDRYDVIALDIDNGPTWLVRPANERAYGEETLRHVRTRLTPAGVFAVWAYEEDVAFAARLQRWFPHVTVHPSTDVNPTGKVLTCFIYLAVKRPG
ncbi:MAG TPA: spermine/spermidine synthase [Armatimonadetes bacterium]|nr:spermine/spermidine synthase [Armatimonadota bacterium]